MEENRDVHLKGRLYDLLAEVPKEEELELAARYLLEYPQTVKSKIESKEIRIPNSGEKRQKLSKLDDIIERIGIVSRQKYKKTISSDVNLSKKEEEAYGVLFNTTHNNYRTAFFNPMSDKWTKIADMAESCDICWYGNQVKRYSQMLAEDCKLNGGTIVYEVYPRKFIKGPVHEEQKNWLSVLCDKLGTKDGRLRTLKEVYSGVKIFYTDVLGRLGIKCEKPAGKLNEDVTKAFCRCFLGKDKHGRYYLYIDIIEGANRHKNQQYIHDLYRWNYIDGYGAVKLGLLTAVCIARKLGVEYVVAGDTGIAQIFEEIGATKIRMGNTKIGLQAKQNPGINESIVKSWFYGESGKSYCIFV